MARVPFLRFLIPMIIGIVFCRFISPSFNPLYLEITGLALILASYILPCKYDYSLRWIFGAGLMLFLFSLTIQFYQFRESQVSCDFPDQTSTYIGEILDLPQQKKRSVACEVHLTYPVDKKIMLYLEPDSNSQFLKPGDEITVAVFVKPFKNSGNPEEFDYETFMHDKGFSGSAYASSTRWSKTGRQSKSLKTKALNVRAGILDIYKSFGLEDDVYSFVSAISLGYKADLSEELKGAFRASGTSHILAVSGLHVGIIYIVILSLFSFLGKRKRYFLIKQILILLFLLAYVFITGMPVSVIRAAVMLSLLCVGNMLNRKGFTYNTLVIAAVFILIINPFYLFDVGFQLSFASVFSILFFQPKLSNLYSPKNKSLKYIWNLLTISFAAQLGVFPLGLYYFGSFPTYFFISNLLILPFIGIIIYLAILLILLSLFSFIHLTFLQVATKTIAMFMQYLINIVLKIVHFIESLPMALIEGHHISMLQLFLIFAIVLSLSFYLLHKQAKLLISFLAFVVLLLASNSYSYLKEPIDQFIVYNNYNESEMGYIINGERKVLQINCNQIVPHPSAAIVLLTENSYKSKVSNLSLPVDYLVLAVDNSFSMTELTVFYQPKVVIIDCSIARYTAERIKKECDKLNVTIHDISNSGAFSVNF